MSWSIGFNTKHNQDIGYGVPAICDHPACNTEINRGLSYLCGDNPTGQGEHGCSLHFCTEHITLTETEEGHVQLCECCLNDKPEFEPKPDTAEWISWKLTDDSWQQWREENPEEVQQMRAAAQ